MQNKISLVTIGLIIIGLAMFIGYTLGTSNNEADISDACTIENIEDAFNILVTKVNYKIDPYNTKAEYEQESPCKWYVEISDVDGENQAFYIEHIGSSEDGDHQYEISSTLLKWRYEVPSDEEIKEGIENLTRSQVCNEVAVEGNFRYWMDFKYPDWKIYDDIVIVSSGDCSYNLRFTTMNPHFLRDEIKDGKKIIVVQFDYTNNYQEFSINFLRGFLY